MLMLVVVVTAAALFGVVDGCTVTVTGRTAAGAMTGQEVEVGEQAAPTPAVGNDDDEGGGCVAVTAA